MSDQITGESQIAGASLLAMRSLAAQATDSMITTQVNLDALARQYAALQVENLKLRAALEEEWLIAHDEHCTNMRDCTSFGGTKSCKHPRRCRMGC